MNGFLNLINDDSFEGSYLCLCDVGYYLVNGTCVGKGNIITFLWHIFSRFLGRMFVLEKLKL